MTFHVAGTVLDYSDAAGRVPDWSAAHPLDGVTVTPAALAEILRLHRLWADSSGGGRRADLTGAVLTRAVLTGADLSDAHLHRAVLTGADLTGACLSGANLSEADLTRAILSEANLSDAILTRAILTRAILTGARYVREAAE